MFKKAKYKVNNIKTNKYRYDDLKEKNHYRIIKLKQLIIFKILKII